MKYVDKAEYLSFVSEIKAYCTVSEVDEKVKITSGMHIGLVVAHKDGKGYLIDSDLLK